MTTTSALPLLVANADAEAHATVQYLFSIASMLRHDRFQSWMERTDYARFDWATPEVYKRINQTFLSHGPSMWKDPNAETRVLLNELATRFDKTAGVVANVAGCHGEPVEAEAAFHFPEGGDEARVFYDFVYRKVTFWKPEKHCSALGMIGCTLRNLREVLASHLTLKHDTGNAGFEAVLESLYPQYLLYGIPAHFLGECADRVRDLSNPAIALYLGTARCDANHKTLKYADGCDLFMRGPGIVRVILDDPSTVAQFQEVMSRRGTRIRVAPPRAGLGWRR